MNTRFTMDPISWHEVTDLDWAPCVCGGHGDNGIGIYFENEEHRRIYLEPGKDCRIASMGNNSDDYVAEG